MREKGGYTRALVDCFPINGGSPVSALIYTADRTNPNFDCAGLLSPSAFAALARRIYAASGPSGQNVEYLRRLGAYLRSVGAKDEHVFSLEQVGTSWILYYLASRYRSK